MKVKDLADLSGCYSAYDVGEQDIDVLEPLNKVKLKEIIASVALGYLSDSQENLIVARIYDAFGKPTLRLPEKIEKTLSGMRGEGWNDAIDKIKELNK